MQKLTYAAQATVTQMVDIIGGAYIVGQPDQITDRSYDIVGEDVFRRQVVGVIRHCLTQPHFVPAALIQDGFQRRVVYHFQYAAILGVKRHILLGIHKVVADNLMHVFFQLDRYFVQTTILDFASHGFFDFLPCFDEHFAGLGVDNILGRNLPLNTRGERQLLIKFVATHTHQIVTLGVEEQ